MVHPINMHDILIKQVFVVSEVQDYEGKPLGKSLQELYEYI